MKKKYKRTGTTSERQDYRKGGQVSKDDNVREKLYYGGGGYGTDFSKQMSDAYGGNISISVPDVFGNTQTYNVSGKPAVPEVNIPVQSTPAAQAQINTGETMSLTEEQKQNNRKGLETASSAQLPEAAKLPNAQQVSPDISQQGTVMDTPTTVGTTQIAQAPQEQAATVGTIQTVPAPTVAPVATVQPTQVVQAPTVTAAQTTLSEDELAKTAGVDRIPTIDAAQVNIQDGALAQRVVGQLSPQAISTAAQASGTTLSRVTRAKKQLRAAGLPEQTITELGDNPEALEDRLTDFTEEQRGVIEGLPEEALISNQMDTLLKGIENGTMPTWAQPAVAAVEQMLAQRGLEASSVGRDNLINAIIQSAVPLAQANAQAIQQSVAQEKNLIAQESLANAQLRQQTALQNAQNVFSLNMAQFNADQQTELANSKFLQTVSLTNASAEQQGIIQNAVLQSQANLVEADANTKLAIQNSKAFLQTDMANLSAQQQVNVLQAQQEQQRMLSNQAATNAAAQFNASQENAAAARNAGRIADSIKLNAQLATQIDQFNANQDFARSQWNAQNAAAVEASNTQWRRQANTSNTAAQNAVNLQNAMNAFNLSSQAQAFLWQELRDNADYVFRAEQGERERIAALVNTAVSSDPASYKNTTSLKNLIGAIVES